MVNKDRLIGRREFLAGSLALSAGTLLSACREGKDAGVYSGPVEQMQGKPLIQEEFLGRLLETLADSPFFLLRKTAADLAVLRQLDSPLPGFPSWLSEESFPLQITRDYSPVSQACVSISWKDRQVATNRFRLRLLNPLPGSKEESIGNQIAKINIGLHLGTPPSLLGSGDRAMALFLAKEHLTQMLILRTSLDFWALLEKSGSFEITDLDGSEIEPARQAQVGASIFLDEMAGKTSETWKVTDGLPILMIGAAVLNLRGNGLLPAITPGGLDFFYLAADQYLAKDPDLYQETLLLIADWLLAESLLPPESTTFKVFSSPVLTKAIIGLQNEISRKLVAD